MRGRPAPRRHACEAVSGHEAGMQIVACTDAIDCSAKLMTLLRDGDAVWLKGSRAMQLDKVFADLQKRLYQGEWKTGLASAAVT